MTITQDEDVLGGEPRIEGTRIAVRQVADMVIDGDQSPPHVADQLDVALAAVYEALSYYYAHLDIMREFARENADAFERVRETGLKPKESVS